MWGFSRGTVSLSSLPWGPDPGHPSPWLELLHPLTQARTPLTQGYPIRPVSDHPTPLRAPQGPISCTLSGHYPTTSG